MITTLNEVTSKRELRRFIRFPHSGSVQTLSHFLFGRSSTVLDS